MIFRFEVADGYPLPEKAEEFHQATGELLMSKMHELEMLVPGQYDVTPKVWTRNTHIHEVLVLENGEGVYRMYPKEADVGTLEVTPEAEAAVI